MVLINHGHLSSVVRVEGQWLNIVLCNVANSPSLSLFPSLVQRFRGRVAFCCCSAFMALMLSATKSLLNKSQKLKQKIMFYVCVLTQWKQAGKWAKHHTGHIVATKQLSTFLEEIRQRQAAMPGSEYHTSVCLMTAKMEREIHMNCNIWMLYSWEVVHYSQGLYSAVETVLLTWFHNIYIYIWGLIMWQYTAIT